MAGGAYAVGDGAGREEESGEQEPADEEGFLGLPGGGEVGLLALSDDAGQEQQQE